MEDKIIIKRLLELGLQKLVEMSGQDVADFIAGSNIPEAPSVPKETPPPVDDQDEENAEWERRFGK